VLLWPIKAVYCRIDCRNVLFRLYVCRIRHIQPQQLPRRFTLWPASFKALATFQKKVGWSYWHYGSYQITIGSLGQFTPLASLGNFIAAAYWGCVDEDRDTPTGWQEGWASVWKEDYIKRLVRCYEDSTWTHLTPTWLNWTCLGISTWPEPYSRPLEQSRPLCSKPDRHLRCLLIELPPSFPYLCSFLEEHQLCLLLAEAGKVIRKVTWSSGSNPIVS